MRLHTLSIVDQRGVERVRLAGALPDAVVQGKRVARGEQAAGILIYDDAGQERGGYATFAPSRTAALTLDTRAGQVVFLAADSSDGGALRLWNGDFRNWIDVRAGSAGARLSIARDRSLVHQQPPVAEAEAATLCGELKGELQQLKVQPAVGEVLRACQQQMPGDACRKCLGIH